MASAQVFNQQGDFAACRAAEAFLAAAGFSVGRIQGADPRGILFGDFDIQKWRNLSIADREALHGQMIGSMRNGPVTVFFADRLPADAAQALDRALFPEGR